MDWSSVQAGITTRPTGSCPVDSDIGAGRHPTMNEGESTVSNSYSIRVTPDKEVAEVQQHLCGPGRRT